MRLSTSIYNAHCIHSHPNMFFSSTGLLSAVLLSSLIGLGGAAPANLEDRETACIALDDCPGENPPQPSATIITPPPPPTTPAPSATFGCLHAADPDGAQGFCPSVAATGWCVCSDSSTYGIETGSNPCGYTAPPASGPTTLASTNCASSTSAAPTATSSSSSRTKCSPAECPKFCDIGNSSAKRSIFEEQDEEIDTYLSKRFYENPDADQFPYQLLRQSYTRNICPASPLTNTFIWKNLATQRGDYAAALQGICGCMTLFVASSNGVFSSHVWENDETNNPPRDLQPANYQATLQDLQTALSAHQSDLSGGQAFLIIPTDPDSAPSPTNPNNYLYGVNIVNAINDTIKTATGGIIPGVTTYNPLDFETSTELGTNRRGTASFQFDPKYTANGQTTRAYRVIAEGTVLALKTGL